jgi:dTDP-4-amino-4,6-dideoxygalactose transaminase
MNIPLSRPYMDQQSKKNVLKVLDSGRYILGDNCKLFEEEFATYIGTKYAILTNSGTSAIFLSLMALNIGEGDEVIVPSHTAFPTVEPIFYTGAKPVFVDINESTYTLSPEEIRKNITDKTKAILPVHLYGHPAKMDSIKKIAKENDLSIIEDCCQAHGAFFKGKKVGAIGDVGCFSFYPSKNMTVGGDGGILTTNSLKIAETVKMLRNHGRKEKYKHEVMGLNLRFNEIQAVVGRIQLKKLDEFNNKRRGIAKLYSECLGSLPVVTPKEKKWGQSAFHLYVIRIEERTALQANLKNHGISTGIHYPIPCHMQPAVNKVMKTPKLITTEKIVDEIVSLPIFPELKSKEIIYVCNRISNYLS